MLTAAVNCAVAAPLTVPSSYWLTLLEASGGVVRERCWLWTPIFSKTNLADCLRVFIVLSVYKVVNYLAHYPFFKWENSWNLFQTCRLKIVCSAVSHHLVQVKWSLRCVTDEVLKIEVSYETGKYISEDSMEKRSYNYFTDVLACVIHSVLDKQALCSSGSEKILCCK